MVLSMTWLECKDMAQEPLVSREPVSASWTDCQMRFWRHKHTSLLGMVCIVWLHAKLVHHYFVWLFLLHWCFSDSLLLFILLRIPRFILHMYIITGNDYIVSLHASLVHSYWALFALFCIPRWFILFGLGWHWFTSCFKCSSLHLFYFMLPRFIISRHGFYLLTYCLTGSSFLGMVCIASLHASHVHHYWEWFVLDHFMLHWFIITGLGWHWFTSCFTWSSLLGRVCIVSLDALLVICKLCIAWLSSLVHHYCAWFAMFHVMLFRFYLTGHGLHYFSFLTGT
jgi:hypothetical protein